MFSLKRQQGASFEHQARLFLESKGLKFIAANQNFKCGELDLIMSDKETIVFVEVLGNRKRRLAKTTKMVGCCKFMANETKYEFRRRRLSF